MVPSSTSARDARRDLRIVWAGLLVALLGWLGSEYGVLYQTGPADTLAISGNLIVLAGLIAAFAGFSVVARRSAASAGLAAST